jgi:hypothetical protein
MRKTAIFVTQELLRYYSCFSFEEKVPKKTDEISRYAMFTNFKRKIHSTAGLLTCGKFSRY